MAVISLVKWKIFKTRSDVIIIIENWDWDAVVR
jgi:hypothetical protein